MIHAAPVLPDRRSITPYVPPLNIVITMEMTTPFLRPAVWEDALQVIDLISSADENALLYLTGKNSLDEAKEVYRQGFSREDVYYSYRFTLVCFVNGRLAGCILAFPVFLSLTLFQRLILLYLMFEKRKTMSYILILWPSILNFVGKKFHAI